MTLKAKFALGALLCLLILIFTLSPLAAQTDESAPSQDGVYQVGVRIMQLTDASRDNRTLKTYIWYPAIKSKDAKPPFAPDTSGAPYPLIIFSHGFSDEPVRGTSVFVNHLVSQGFIVAAVNHLDLTDLGFRPHIELLLDRPLDVLFLLNQLTDLKDDALVGVIDTDNVGVAGYSFGGYTSLVVGGARVDPGHFTDWCAPPSSSENFDSCKLLADWDKLLAYHQQVEPASTGDLWDAITDDRIHAILVFSPCFGQLFGERGLAALTVPALVMSGTADDICPYDIDASYFYEYLGSPDRYLVTLNKRDHFWVDQQYTMVRQYMSAFFGLYLQGKTDYAQYLIPDSADAFKDVTLEATLGEQ